MTTDQRLAIYRKRLASTLAQAALAATDLTDSAAAVQQPSPSQRAGAAAPSDAPDERTGRTRRPAATSEVA